MSTTGAVTITSSSEQETAAAVAALAQTLAAGDLVALTGPLGAGKSVAARALARALGVEETMPSPSFALVHEYEAAIPVRHIDLYRLADADEVDLLDLETERPYTISIIEWPERSPRIMAEAAVVVSLTMDQHDPDVRYIEIRGDRR